MTSTLPSPAPQLHAGGGLQPPSFREDSGAVWVWVAMPDGQHMGAILSRQLLQYRFQALADGSNAVATYEANRGEIDAAIRRRAAAGSREPVMLREFDLPPVPRR